MRDILRERGNISSPRYAAAVDWVQIPGRAFAAFLHDFDVILTPSLTRDPPRISELEAFDEGLELATMIEHFHSCSPFTALLNASGQPTMSVPLYWTGRQQVCP